MLYSVQKADIELNKDDILNIWKQNFPHVNEERYPWIYDNNPAGRASCWLLKDEKTSEYIGAATIFSRRLLIEGRLVTAGIAGDFFIDKNHRTLGPALTLQKSILSDCKSSRYQLLYGFPNKLSERVLQRCGYKVLGNAIRMAKPLKSSYQIKKYLDVPHVTQAVSGVVDHILAVTSRETRYKRPKGLSVNILSAFDKRFDTLWEKVAGQFPVMGERNNEYLTWRFSRCPSYSYHILAINRDEGDLVGYIAFRKSGNYVSIDDLLVLDFQETFNALMSEFLLHQRKEAVSGVSITFLKNHIFVKQLEQYGFHIRENDYKVIIYTGEPSLATSFHWNPDNWYLLPGDNDI